MAGGGTGGPSGSVGYGRGEGFAGSAAANAGGRIGGPSGTYGNRTPGGLSAQPTVTSRTGVGASSGKSYTVRGFPTTEAGGRGK